MPEAALAPKPALHFTPVESGGTRLAAMPEGAILQVLGHPEDLDLGGRLAALGLAPFAVRAAAPGQWFVIAPDQAAGEPLGHRIAQAAPNAAVADQSHGRVRIALSGPGAEAVLAGGTFIDASPAAFPAGCSAQTLFGHIGIHLTRTGPDAFELMVLRGFAVSLWEELAARLRIML